MGGGEREREDILEGTPYRALSELGRGGMGSVFVAEHRVLKKRLAVKLLRAELADREELADRLRVEAEVLANLASPHVVEVLDCGVTGGGEPYIAMELLVGRSLQEALRDRGFFPVAEAIELTRQATKGVLAAHERGIVHRDLKPANLFVCQRPPSEPPLVKVLDFGVAKILSGPVAPPKVATAPWTVIGSPKTMSPEACLGERVDERSDVYSLGIVLYMLLTGRGPFEDRKELADYARAHVSEAPAPPSAVARQAISAEVDALVLRALEKDPARRFQSARELVEALERVLDPALADPREDTAKAALRVQAARASGVTPGGGAAAVSRGTRPASSSSHLPRVIVASGAASDSAPSTEKSARRATGSVPRALVAVTLLIGIGILGFLLGRSGERTAPGTTSAAPTIAPSVSTSTPAPIPAPSSTTSASASAETSAPASAPVDPPARPASPASAPHKPVVGKTAPSAAAPKPTSEFYE